jgi:hypothetical protein
MDANECKTMIHTARETQGKTPDQIVKMYAKALGDMKKNSAAFRKKILG